MRKSQHISGIHPGVLSPYYSKSIASNFLKEIRVLTDEIILNRPTIIAVGQIGEIEDGLKCQIIDAERRAISLFQFPEKENGVSWNKDIFNNGSYFAIPSLCNQFILPEGIHEPFDGGLTVYFNLVLRSPINSRVTFVLESENECQLVAGDLVSFLDPMAMVYNIAHPEELNRLVILGFKAKIIDCFI